MTDHMANDKVIDHTRLQLSALFDGELALDEARFLQRRLQHDVELGECVSRWQLTGDILRGQATAAAPAGFAQRIAAAVAAEAAQVVAPAMARRSRWGWGSGAALAASVAMVALFMARQAPDALPPTSVPAVGIASTVPLDAQPAPAPSPASTPTPDLLESPDTAAQLAVAGLAVVETPRRVAAARRSTSRGQAQRAAVTRQARAVEQARQPQLAVASAHTATHADVGNPFTPAARSDAPRPWPRALLPNAGTAFNVGYGTLPRPVDASPSELSVSRPAHPFRAGPAAQATEPAPNLPSPR